MSEAFTLPADAVNEAFDNELDILIDGIESKSLAGFTGFETVVTHNDTQQSHGYIPAHFVIRRITDAKLFAAAYYDTYDGVEAPFMGNVVFQEVEYRTRTITVEYLEVI